MAHRRERPAAPDEAGRPAPNDLRGALGKHLAEVRASFEACAEAFTGQTLANTTLRALQRAWEAHYHGAFSRFDHEVRAASARASLPHTVLSVSISHHNLHRLMEVLRIEIGGAPLAASRSPERVLDLSDAASRLARLLEEAASMPHR